MSAEFMRLVHGYVLINRPPKFAIFFHRKLPLLERLYCWFLVFVGVFGGIAATYTAIRNIVQNEFSPPCYISRQ